MAAKKSRNSHVTYPTAPLVGDDDYKEPKRKLDHHFLPKKNKQHEYTFNKQKQIESVVTSAQLREKSQDCEFGEQTEDRILTLDTNHQGQRTC